MTNSGNLLFGIRKPGIIPELEIPLIQTRFGKKIITVYSPLGGVGKTTAAFNLANHIKETEPTTKVLLLDGDFLNASLCDRYRFPEADNVTRFLDYIDSQSIQESISNLAAQNKSQKFIVSNPSAPFDVLYNVNSIGANKTLVENALEVLSGAYDVVIIDAGTEIIATHQSVWLSKADDILLISELEIDRLYNTSKAYKYIRQNSQANFSVAMTSFKAEIIHMFGSTTSFANSCFSGLREKDVFSLVGPDESIHAANANGISIDDVNYIKGIKQITNHMF